ncbi:unnamed protein product [Agarophyton chilense]
MNSHFMSSGAPVGDEEHLPSSHTEAGHYNKHDENLEDMLPQCWYEQSCTQVDSHNDPVGTFDSLPHKELIWVATASGMLHAHHVLVMARTVSTFIAEPTFDPSNHGDVRHILVSDSFVLTALGYVSAVLQHGGVLSSSMRCETIKYAKSIALNPVSDSYMCTGGESRMLVVIHIQQQRIMRQATLRGAPGVTAAVWTAPHHYGDASVQARATYPASDPAKSAAA